MARPPSPVRLITLLALLVLLAAPSLGQSAGVVDPDTEWDLLGKSRMGDPAADPPYVLELRTRTDAGLIETAEEAVFRFDLRWRHNDTRVLDAPHLQVFAYRCVQKDTAEATCDPVVRETTETGAVLDPTATTFPPGVYLWVPDPDRVFTEEGTWHIEARPADQTTNVTARFPVDVVASLGGVGDVFRELGERLGLDPTFLFRFILFILLLTGIYVGGRVLVSGLHRTVLSPGRIDPTAGRLLARLIMFSVLLVGFSLSLWLAWDVNVWSMLTALGLLTVALGFGMQNTVANLMGGVNLALDKPFTIGDRIEVGESWGDVVTIGIRSTTILTPKKETVIIPNKLLDEREIWNYTIDHPEMRLDIDCGISYDSDWRLAQVLMIEAAQEHKEILSYPRPQVLMMEFGDFAVVMQLRCWLGASKQARPVSSDLRKAIKDKFDAEGVEIPFPYRTLVDKGDLPAPKAVTPEHLERVETSEKERPRMLALTAGVAPARRSARLVCKTARRLDLGLVVAHVVPRITPQVRRNASEIFGIYKNAAQMEGVRVETVLREGELVPETMHVAAEETIDLLMLGSGRSHIFGSATKVSEVTRRVRAEMDIPVLIVPPNLTIPERTIEHYRRVLEERHAERRRRDHDVGEQGDREGSGDDVAE